MAATRLAARSRAVVVGGGFVGLSCALHLQRTGAFSHVLLMEAGAEVGGRQSASNGNAGTFAYYANVPVQRPGLWREAPGMILSPTGALRLAATPHLARMLPWAAGALASCAPAEVRKTALALGTLLRRAEDGYRGAWDQAGVDVDGPMGRYAPSPAARGDAFAARRGYLLLQRDVHSASSRAVAALRAEGLDMPPERLAMHALDQAAVLELEPNLAPEAARGGAWFFERGWFLRDPAALLAAMRDGFARRGGEIRCSDEGITSGDPSDPGSRDTRRSGRVTSLASTADGTVRVGASDGSFVDAARVVVAAGARSADLARLCGDDVPLDTERGYHVQWVLEGEEEGGGVGARGGVGANVTVGGGGVANGPTFAGDPSAALARPVCTPEGGFIATPMSRGLRSAGLVELGGLDAAPVAARFEQLERATRALLREDVAAALGGRDASRDWLGFRPTLPDALPVIGDARGVPGVTYAFGHQHVGWTLGGVTGEIVADLARGREPGVDLAPFSPRRFEKKLWWRPFKST